MLCERLAGKIRSDRLTPPKLGEATQRNIHNLHCNVFGLTWLAHVLGLGVGVGCVADRSFVRVR